MGSGYWVLVADDVVGPGLQLVNPRLLEVDGRTWWPALPGDEVDEAIRRHRLPWLDPLGAPSVWQGGPFGSTDFAWWKVIVT